MTLLIYKHFDSRNAHKPDSDLFLNEVISVTHATHWDLALGDFFRDTLNTKAFQKKQTKTI